MFQPRNIQAEQSSSHQYFPALDYLRFALALSVAAYHANLLPWKLFGEIPVQIFFAMSGWLIGGILIRARAADLPRFYWHRALRIWPPYFAAVAIILCLGLWKDQVTPKWIEFAFYKLTLTFNFFGTPQWQQYAFAPMNGSGAPFWSIAAEEQFYLVAPFLVALLPFGRHLATWIVIACAVLASSAYYDFAAISFGVLAAVSRERFGDWHRTRTGQILLVAVMALVSITFFTNGHRLFDALIGTPLVLLLARPGRPSKVISFAGGISFPLYLNHWLGIWLITAACNKLHISIGITAQLVMVAACVAIAGALYCLIDIKARQYRDYHYTTRRGVIAALIAVALVGAGIIGGLIMTTSQQIHT